MTIICKNWPGYPATLTKKTKLLVRIFFKLSVNVIYLITTFKSCFYCQNVSGSIICILCEKIDPVIHVNQDIYFLPNMSIMSKLDKSR
jgi:hypothetical protein